MDAYYRDDYTTIYHGDSLDLLPELGEGTADAVIADPPYVFGPTSALRARGWWADLMNASWWFAAWYKEAGRIIKPTGSFWTFHNWRSAAVVHKASVEAGLDITAQVVWDKVTLATAVGGPRGPRRRYELITLMPGPDFTIPDRSMADVWPFSPGGPRKPHGHPAEKPEGIVTQIITACQLGRGALVVDPFAGSGTTLAAARALGLRAIGIEADERWCEVAATRLAAERYAS